MTLDEALRTQNSSDEESKTIFTMKAAKKVEEIDKNLLKLEDIFAR